MAARAPNIQQVVTARSRADQSERRLALAAARADAAEGALAAMTERLAAAVARERDDVLLTSRDEEIARLARKLDDLQSTAPAARIDAREVRRSAGIRIAAGPLLALDLETLDALSDREIMCAVLEARGVPALTRSDAYVLGRFAHEVGRPWLARSDAPMNPDDIQRAADGTFGSGEGVRGPAQEKEKGGSKIEAQLKEKHIERARKAHAEAIANARSHSTEASAEQANLVGMETYQRAVTAKSPDKDAPHDRSRDREKTPDEAGEIAAQESTKFLTSELARIKAEKGAIASGHVNINDIPTEKLEAFQEVHDRVGERISAIHGDLDASYKVVGNEMTRLANLQEQLVDGDGDSLLDKASANVELSGPSYEATGATGELAEKLGHPTKQTDETDDNDVEGPEDPEVPEDPGSPPDPDDYIGDKPEKPEPPAPPERSDYDNDDDYEADLEDHENKTYLEGYETDLADYEQAKKDFAERVTEHEAATKAYNEGIEKLRVEFRESASKAQAMLEELHAKQIAALDEIKAHAKEHGDASKAALSEVEDIGLDDDDNHTLVDYSKIPTRKATPDEVADGLEDEVLDEDHARVAEAAANAVTQAVQEHREELSAINEFEGARDSLKQAVKETADQIKGLAKITKREPKLAKSSAKPSAKKKTASKRAKAEEADDEADDEED